MSGASRGIACSTIFITIKSSELSATWRRGNTLQIPSSPPVSSHDKIMVAFCLIIVSTRNYSSASSSLCHSAWLFNKFKKESRYESIPELYVGHESNLSFREQR